MELQNYVQDAIALLQELIKTPSFSREENLAADIMAEQLFKYGYSCQREGNNLWIKSQPFDSLKPTILLNAHIDTVKPVSSWTRDPFAPTIENNEILYGLGSNDCGGGLVSLLQAFRILTNKPQTYNLVYLVSAEEEVSGSEGFRRVKSLLPPIDMAIVGEPTSLQPAIAEKGLMVLRITWHGKSGHAARNEGINAIYEALDDLNWLRHYHFEKESTFLGPTKMNITVINAGTQHNVVPDKCEAVVDIRTNEHYTNHEVFDLVSSHVKGDVQARSFDLESSSINISHPFVKRCIELGMQPYGSPTLSDQSLMPFDSLKLGPGDSSRSHSADEYIKISEIERAIQTYVKLLDGFHL